MSNVHPEAVLLKLLENLAFGDKCVYVEHNHDDHKRFNLKIFDRSTKTGKTISHTHRGIFTDLQFGDIPPAILITMNNALLDVNNLTYMGLRKQLEARNENSKMKMTDEFNLTLSNNSSPRRPTN